MDNCAFTNNLIQINLSNGCRFPWESAYTGVEVTQPCCPEVAEFEQHITGCISFAARQYLATTRDEDWLKVTECFKPYITHKY